MQPSASPPPTAPAWEPPPPASGARAVVPVGPPPLRPWSRIWRYLAAAGIALVVWFVVVSDVLGDPLATEQEARAGAALFLDLLLGVVALCLLPLRRRHPLLTACLTAALTVVSASAVGAAFVATVSVATWRRWRWALPVLTVWVLATIGYEAWWRPTITGEREATAFTLLSGGLAMGVVGTCLATGYYVGARRELIETLRLRAETAEREQALEAETAREAERTRIAREMHDVLAHRISLVAMHAGALAYRTDLTQEETAEAAGVIQDSAHLALSELREVLGVLRTEAAVGSGPAEPPQPLITQLPGLLASATDQLHVTVDTAGLPDGDPAALGGLPVTTSRTAYRIVQESLTNARKHAPGSDVVIRLAGRPGGLLTMEIHNGPPAGDRSLPAAPGSGYGLVGLQERVQLAQGALEHEAGPAGAFTVRSWLPWEEKR